MMRVAPFLVATLFPACTISTLPTGPIQYDSQAIERGAAETAQIHLNMGAGDLKVSSGTQKLMAAYFTYNTPTLKPEVRNSTSGGVASISIDQPSSHAHFGHVKYEWDLRLNDSVPLDLDVHFGAGQANLDIGSLSLRSVTVNMGVGELQLDLRGTPKHDYTVNVHGGVGEAVLRLPGNVGIEAYASGGIGDISVHGLTKDGARWINEAARGDGPKIRVRVEGGVGQIKLNAE